MKRRFWISLFLLMWALIFAVLWARAQDSVRVLLLAGRFDSKMERLRLTLDVPRPGVYLLRIERTDKVTRLIVEDAKTGRIEWIGKLEKEK